MIDNLQECFQSCLAAMAVYDIVFAWSESYTQIHFGKLINFYITYIQIYYFSEILIYRLCITSVTNVTKITI